ncbi:MAG TPA: hypothetical protein VG101_15510 [Puia sp.]|jgi:hypothetical protein|nr:hypothetical protein [Puia sp.]
MSVNIVAESSSHLDYYDMHDAVYEGELPFDFIPMPNLGVDGGDALGICIPTKNAIESTWLKLLPVLEVLRTKFDCDVYELYGGEQLTDFNRENFRSNLFLK